MEYLKFLGIGLMGGVTAGLLGAGGGVFIIPILIYITNIEIKTATSISAVQVFFASSFGTLFNWLQKTIDLRCALIIGLPGAVSYFFGSYFTGYFPETVIKIIYLSVVILALALFFIKKKNRPTKDGEGTGPGSPEDIKPYFKVVPISLVAGFAFGILGVGGGFLYVPLLVLLFNFPLRQAIGTSLLIVLFNAIPGIAGKLLSVRFDFFIGLAVAAGAIGGSRLGTYLSKKLKPKVIRVIFIVLLSVIIIRVAFDLYISFSS